MTNEELLDALFQLLKARKIQEEVWQELETKPFRHGPEMVDDVLTTLLVCLSQQIRRKED